jgi:hypothetical protein
VAKELKHSNDNDDSIELDFQAPRESFAQTARLICEAVPDDAPILLYKCEECENHHLRIMLPTPYTEKFADRLGSKIAKILDHSPAASINHR